MILFLQCAGRWDDDLAGDTQFCETCETRSSL